MGQRQGSKKVSRKMFLEHGLVTKPKSTILVFVLLQSDTMKSMTKRFSSNIMIMDKNKDKDRAAIKSHGEGF